MHERILIIEDELPMRTALQDCLQAEEYRVLTAADGELGLKRALEEKPDLILLDIMLPHLDGFALCTELRRLEISTPVLMLTAKGQIEDRVSGLDAGADDYLTKPFAVAELLARLRALLRRGARERPAVLRVGDLSLDPAVRVVRRGDREIALTPKEFALLEYFMRHPDEVLTRTRLIEHVWDFAFEGDSNVVEVYVRYLREKVDRPFGRASIETVRGVGYRLRSEESR